MVSSTAKSLGLVALLALGTLGCEPPAEGRSLAICSNCEAEGDVEQVAHRTDIKGGVIFGPTGGKLSIPLGSMLSDLRIERTVLLDLIVSAAGDNVGTLITSIDWKDCASCPLSTERVEFRVDSECGRYRALEDVGWDIDAVDSESRFVIEGQYVVAHEMHFPDDEDD